MKKPSMIAAGIGFLLALAAAVYLSWAPCAYRGVTVTSRIPDGAGTRHSTCSSLIEVNGPAVIGWLAVPVLLTGTAFLMARLQMRVAVWACAVISMALSVLTGFSIGLLFMPSSFALLIAAVLGVITEENTTRQPLR